MTKTAKCYCIMCLCAYFDIFFLYLLQWSDQGWKQRITTPMLLIFNIWQQFSVRLIACNMTCAYFPLPKLEDLPEMTSSRSMSFSPSLKSSSMFSICVPAFLRWELHHAVNVYKKAQEHHKNGEYLESEPCFSDFYHNKSHFEWKTAKFNWQEGR